MSKYAEPGPLSGLLGDDPLEEDSNDIFNRGPFANRVVELLDHVASDTPSAVLALLGPWGSGKTSLLRMVENQLRGHGDWQVIQLNPWMLADLSSMIEEFFLALVSVFPDGNKGKAIRRRAARYARAVSPITSPLRLVGLDTQGVLDSLSEFLSGDQSLEARRTELQSSLRKYGKPILLVADDLDRLQPDELLLMFKLVRLLGRLPNTYYLLAFDERTALDLLEATDLARSDPSRALAYLEKVVQIRLDLPPVHPRQAARLLDDILEKIIQKHGIAMSSQATARLSSAYRDHMINHLSEPRQIKRYCSQIEATYQLVADEVDFSDFAVITFLRTFHPGVIATLVENRDELLRRKLEIGQKATSEVRLDRWRARLTESEVKPNELSSVLKLLSGLFNEIRGAAERMDFSGYRGGRQQERRVDTNEYFDRYFYLGVGESDIKDSVVRDALVEACEGEPGTAWAEVVKLLPENSELVLDKLRRLAPDDPAAAVRLAPLVARFDCTIERSGLLDRAGAVFRFWMAELIGRAEPADPVQFVSELTIASSVLVVADACHAINRRSLENDATLTPTQVAIRTAVVNAIRVELDRQAALPPDRTDSVWNLLTYWQLLAPASEARVWMSAAISSGEWPMPDVLGLFASIGSMSSGGPVVPALGDPDLELLDAVVDPTLLAQPDVDSLGSNVDWDRDVSFPNRIRRVALALAAREARGSSNSPST